MDTSWTIIKAFIDTASLPVSYVDIDQIYFIFASNGALVLQCKLIQDGGADQIDFETNYKPTANQAPTQNSIVQASTVTAGPLANLSDTLAINCINDASVRLYIAGTWIGAISFYGSTDGINFDPIYALDVSGAPTQNVQASTSDSYTAWKFDTTGYASLQIEMTSYTSGTADLTAIGSKYASLLSGIVSPITVNGVTKIRDSADGIILLGETDMAASLPVVIANNQTPFPVTVSGGISLPSGAATAALQTQPGVDIGDVTINNSTGGSAVNIQDGGNVITVDNNGTFVTQSTLAAETTKVIGTVNISANQNVGLSTGSNVIGHVINDAGSAIIGKVGIDQTTPGTTNLVALAANQSVNVAQMNGTTVTMGNGASGTGVQRVTIADDSTGLVKLATGANTIGALTANQSVNVAQMNGVTVTMGNGAAGTGVQRVTLADDSTGLVKLATGANTIGALTANQSVNNAQIAGVATATGNGGVSTGVQRVAIASDNTAFAVNATGPTLTKGTQGSTGFSVQDLKDSGRVHKRYYAVAAAAGTTTTETAITLTLSSENSATSTGTSFTPTNGKKFRITYISFATRGHSTATIQTTTFNLRMNTAGAVTTSSTPILLAMRSATAAVASAWDRAVVEIPDGIEITGDGTLQWGVTAAATYTTNAPTWDVTIIGYEY